MPLPAMRQAMRRLAMSEGCGQPSLFVSN